MRLILKTLGGLIVSSIIIALMLLATSNGMDWQGPRDTLTSVVVFFPFVAGFSALGLFILMPLAMLLARRKASIPLSLLTLVFTGSVLGWLMLLLMPFIAASWLGAVAGAITAAVWVTANRSFFWREIRA